MLLLLLLLPGLEDDAEDDCCCCCCAAGELLPYISVVGLASVGAVVAACWSEGVGERAAGSFADDVVVVAEAVVETVPDDVSAEIDGGTSAGEDGDRRQQLRQEARGIEGKEIDVVAVTVIVAAGVGKREAGEAKAGDDEGEREGWFARRRKAKDVTREGEEEEESYVKTCNMLPAPLE